MSANSGGPAFPRQHTVADANLPGFKLGHDGMTLRDYFAAKVCAAMVSTIRTDNDYHRAVQLARLMGFDGLSEWFAADAYKQADAMLRARGEA